MILALQSARFCQKLSWISTTKVLTTTYSASAVQPKHKPKQSRLKEPPHVTVNEKSKVRSIIIDSKTILPPNLGCTGSNITTDTSTALSNPTWKLGSIEIDASKLHKYCLMLSKIRLTSLVVITAAGGYAIAPGPFDLYTFVACSLGTGLISAAANAVNQSMEVPFDAKMARTKNRVLVRGLLEPEHAMAFAGMASIAGITLLATQVNTTTALLGGANLVLYTAIYTPMKRVHIVNTWVGSVVGAIPPLMGWAGCVGDICSTGAWIMPGILYAWQFPHFNALSWNLRPDYSKAGYRMMAISNPDLCRRVSFRYTVVLAALSYLAPVLDVTNWWFAVASTPVNAYFLKLAWDFRQKGDARTSRRLFRFSLLHLPILMTLMLLCKKYWFINAEKKESKQLNENGRLLEAMSRVLHLTSA